MIRISVPMPMYMCASVPRGRAKHAPWASGRRLALYGVLSRPRLGAPDPLAVPVRRGGGRPLDGVGHVQQRDVEAVAARDDVELAVARVDRVVAGGAARDIARLDARPARRAPLLRPRTRAILSAAEGA